MEKQIILEANELSFRYPGNQYDSVKDLSLQVSEGSCMGIIGPNGAGKSTLISMLCGLIEETKGQITYYPQQFKNKQQFKDRQAIIKKQVALIPQDYAFYPELTVKQNLEYFIALNDYNASNRKSILDNTLQQCQLTNVIKQKTENLSGGYKRRLNIAIALSKSPKIIFLDEPTVGIDPVSRRDIISLLQSLKSSGITLIYSSHILNEIEELCDDILLLESGKAISVKHLSNNALLLSFEISKKEDNISFLQTMGVEENTSEKTRFQIKIKNERQLKEKLQILTENIHNVKNIHYSQNSIDQIYFDSVKAKNC